VADEPLKEYADVQPGDCVVAFSKQDIFRIREEIERLTPYKCCVVYGQLPPETRSKQVWAWKQSKKRKQRKQALNRFTFLFGVEP